MRNTEAVINMKEQICLLNVKYLWIAVKRSWLYEQIWLPNEEYLRGHRYEGTYMAYKCITLSYINIV